MKATLKLVAVAGIAGLSLAACGASHSAAANSTSSSTTSSTSATSSGPTTAVPANAPVGFNAAKTAFVLPYKLGLLPASELALAKADAAYAAGLANLSDWVQTGVPVTGTAAPSPGEPPKMVQTWFYIGSSIANNSASAQQTMAKLTNDKSTTIVWNTMISSLGGPSAAKAVNSTSVAVQDSTLNPLMTAQSRFSGGSVLSGDQLVAGSNLEIQAAPIGTLAIPGNNVPAFCVPTPEAWLANGKPVNVTGLPTITAGPATVFAAPIFTQDTQSSPPPASSVVLYDQGVASCVNFK